MLSDHPTLDDKLNRLPLLQAKAAQIASCTAPQTFGIHGDWGAGKTSFLRQLRCCLDGNKDGCSDDAPELLRQGQYKQSMVTVWFDAWQYQHEPAPVIALLHEIRKQFGAWLKLKHNSKKLANVATRSVLNALSDITKLMKLEALPLSAKDIQKSGEDWEKQHLETRLGVDTIQSFLQQAISEIIGKDKKLVIFIDDLDRCSSSAAYRLLEGLKIYLNLSNCVFVLGMNQKIIVDAIAKEMTSFDGQNTESSVRIYAEAYLEKLCASIERLTPPRDCEQLLINWINADQTQLKNALNDVKNDNALIRCLPPNPRRIKALANVLNQWLQLPQIQTIIEEQQPYPNLAYQGLLVLAYVYQFHSEIFQRWQFNPEFFRQLNRWATRPWHNVQLSEDQGAAQPQWPNYLNCLELPNRIEADTRHETSEPSYISNYPDPYAINIFWIQPLMCAAQLQPSDITPIMSAITAYDHSAPNQP